MAKFDIYALGNAIVDIQLSVEEEDIEKLGLTKAGMRLCDRFTQEQILSHFRDRPLSRSSGGSAANTLILNSQLCGTSAYCSLVGRDAEGEHYFDEMRRLGIEMSTEPLADEPTGTSIILITPDAERTMNTHLGANVMLDEHHVDEAALAESSWLYIEGYKVTEEGGRRTINRALDIAKAAGVKAALTFSDGFIVEGFHEVVHDITRRCDLVFANTNEARHFTREKDEATVFAALQTLCPNCVMTRSEKGAWVAYGGKTSQLDPFPVTAVDDTGAGDAFAGAFLWGITHSLDGERAGRLGCFLASQVVSRLGARLHGDVMALCEKEGLI